MNILHVIPGMANSSGPTHVVAHLTDELCSRGHSCSLFYVSGREADLDVPLHPDCHVQGFAARGPRHWGYSPDLQKELYRAALECDIIHCHSMWLYPNIAASRAACSASVPYIVRPAGSLEPWCFRGLKKRLYLSVVERRILNRSAGIHAVSQQEAENLKAFGFKAPIFVTPNGVDIPPAQPPIQKAGLRRKHNLPKDRRIVLFLSRIHPKKGLEVLGEAFLAVRRQLPEALLVIAGPDDHEYATYVKQLYKKLGLGADAVFLGELTGQNKKDVYSVSDVFVLPTHSENFGVVVLEAMAQALPVVVSKNAPWAIVEEREAGYWVENRPHDIATALLSVLQDPLRAEQLAQNARKLVIEQFAWASVVDSLERVYLNVIDGRAPTVSCGSMSRGGIAPAVRQ